MNDFLIKDLEKKVESLIQRYRFLENKVAEISSGSTSMKSSENRASCDYGELIDFLYAELEKVEDSVPLHYPQGYQYCITMIRQYSNRDNSPSGS